MKPKVAFYWCASCGGCEEAVVDLAERILEVASAVDIVFWPVALDFKREDVEAMPDGSILATFLNGAIRTAEQQEMAHLLRRKSTLLIAFGTCSQLGGIPGLANLYDRENVFRTVYEEAPSTVNPENVQPQERWQDNGHLVSLPDFYDTVCTLEQTAEVDYSVPGCPPTPEILLNAITILLSSRLPQKGSVLAPDHALCEDCPRRDTRPVDLSLSEFKRPHQIVANEQECLLAQKLLCLGPATRSGCGALCIKGNMPCTGCFGPTSRVRDYGGKALSAVASLVASTDGEQIEAILAGIPDPVGTFYRYTLPASLLRRKRLEATTHGS